MDLSVTKVSVCEGVFTFETLPLIRHTVNNTMRKNRFQFKNQLSRVNKLMQLKNKCRFSLYYLKLGSQSKNGASLSLLSSVVFRPHLEPGFQRELPACKTLTNGRSKRQPPRSFCEKQGQKCNVTAGEFFFLMQYLG